jgi:hypothetical protein
MIIIVKFQKKSRNLRGSCQMAPFSPNKGSDCSLDVRYPLGGSSFGRKEYESKREQEGRKNALPTDFLTSCLMEYIDDTAGLAEGALDWRRDYYSATCALHSLAP